MTPAAEHVDQARARARARRATRHGLVTGHGVTRTAVTAGSRPFANPTPSAAREVEPGEQARRGAGRADRQDDARGRRAGAGLDLLGQLDRRRQRAHRALGRRAARRHHPRRPARAARRRARSAASPPAGARPSGSRRDRRARRQDRAQVGARGVAARLREHQHAGVQAGGAARASRWRPRGSSRRRRSPRSGWRRRRARAPEHGLERAHLVAAVARARHVLALDPDLAAELAAAARPAARPGSARIPRRTHGRRRATSGSRRNSATSSRSIAAGTAVRASPARSRGAAARPRRTGTARTAP